MNIAIDIRCLMDDKLTGVGEYTYNLLKNVFQEDSHNQYYLFYNSRKDVSAQVKRFQQDNVHYCEFKYPNKFLNLCLLLFKRPNLDKLIARKFNIPIDKFFFPNIGFIQTKCPYIITCHDLSFEYFPEFLSTKRKLWHKIVNPKKLYSKAEKVFAVSENTARDLNVQCPARNASQSVAGGPMSKEKIKTTPLGINKKYKDIRKPEFKNKLEKIKRKYNLPNKFVLALSTIEPRKNLESLITAFEAFNQEFPEYKLVIAGPKGWGNTKTRKHRKHENHNSITWIGFVDEKDKRYLYNLASMFVYPSHYEGFGFPPLEAMACGCPVITSNNSSLAEVCENSAILVDSHNINDILLAMKEMTKSDVANHYRNKGFEQIKRFDWGITAKDFVKQTNS